MILGRIACIVEGHGETQAVPILVRRIAHTLDLSFPLQINCTLRLPRYKLVRPGELERAVELAARKTGGRGAILILIDSDDDCPARLGPQLLERARKARSDFPIGVILAKSEFKCWFLAAAESLRGHRGLPSDLSPPLDPESIRGAKEWLRDRMTGEAPYSPSLDQPALTACFDLELAAGRSDSFEKCIREIKHLILSLYRLSVDANSGGVSP
jgi:hypothetical protein